MALPLFATGIVASLVSTLISGIVWLAKKLLIAFGIGLVSYIGIQPMIDKITNTVIGLVTADDKFNISAWLGVLNFGESVSVILSALSFAVTMRLYNQYKWRFLKLST